MKSRTRLARSVMGPLVAVALTATFVVGFGQGTAVADEEVHVCEAYSGEDALSRTWTDRGPASAGGTADGVEQWAPCDYEWNTADNIIDEYRDGWIQYHDGANWNTCYTIYGYWLGYFDNQGFHWENLDSDWMFYECNWLNTSIKVLTQAKLQFNDTAVIEVWSAVTEQEL